MEKITREQKSKEIASNRYDITRVRDDYYYIKSQTTNREYTIWLSKVGSSDTWKCNCPDHMFRGKHCKHIHAIESSINFREEKREKNKVIISPISNTNCIFCQSDNIIKDGLRHNKYGDIQKWYCKNCNHCFTINVGFQKMKNNPKGITTAMHLYFSGESLRNTAKSLRLLGMDVSHQTIYNWIKKYVKLMQKYLNRIVPEVGDAWRADEIFIKVRGKLKYLFSMMDDETRFWISQEVADRKEGHDARGLLQKAKQVTKKKPKTFTTDGLGSYHVAYKKEFWTVKRQNRTVHVRHIHLQKDMHNNKMERLNGEFRDREKVIRGIKKKNSVIIDGYQLFHNYFRPHMGLKGNTPAQICGIQIQGNNKWKTLIENASLANEPMTVRSR